MAGVPVATAAAILGHSVQVNHRAYVLEDALQLVRLYAERGSPKYEKAAMRWLGRYLTESTP